MDPDTYCRDIEAYLCRKNDGHLVRVVGPAFGMVTGWAARGVPFKVACRGIDRYFERYYAKGTRRRPVRIEFCEADVLDIFDEWRRAVGLGMAGLSGPTGMSAATPADTERRDGRDSAGASAEPGSTRAGGPAHSLRAHLDRAVTRLTDLQARGGLPERLQDAVGQLIDRLAKDREISRTLRGEARAQFLRVLEQLDAELLQAARQATAEGTLAQLREEAADDLSEYRSRMPADAYERSVRAASDKLLRDHWKLPAVAY
jgi:hypothetical protein